MMAMWSLILIPEKSFGQCANNIGFESGNFTSWTTVTDSDFITPATRRYIKPGRNMGVINYGGTDVILGTLFKANSTVGNKLIKVGNRSVNATADTVYRKYVIDSLSDKLTIYSYGVVELAHNYWNVPVVEAPGFGYEVYVNGRKLDCLKGAFFCGNVDQPPVWQLGSFKDSGGVRKSTGWGAETLNFACFVGDTIEVRLFTRDCILKGHYAYAYFDVVCGDTSKPVISQISVKDLIASDSLDLFCTQDATLKLQPNTDICPVFMGNIQWTPQSYIVGSKTVDSALIHVPDSVWIYASASFSNYCQSVTILDSIYVRYWAYDPHNNLPKIDRNYCECGNDTLDFTGVNVKTIWDNASKTYSLNTNNQLIINPCDNFLYQSSWKNPSSRIVTSGGQIGTSSWTSGNLEGAVSVDSLTGAGYFRFVSTIAVGKSYYVGLNTNSTSNGVDMKWYVLVNGPQVKVYYNGFLQSTLPTSYSGNVNIDFEVLSNKRVRILINGSVVYNYSNSQKATFPVFGDFSANSNNASLLSNMYVYGPIKPNKTYNNVQNKTTFEYYLTYVDRCGLTVNDTIRFIPGFSAMLSPNLTQCGLNRVQFNMSTTAPSLIDKITWFSNGSGNFIGPSGNGDLRSSSANLSYDPSSPDYNTKPVTVMVMAQSGSCSVVDTLTLTVNEVPTANAGPDISTTLDTFNIGGSPSGNCGTCGKMKYDWNQGYAMNDSTMSDPSVYKSKITDPRFFVKVYDSTTGCYSVDTAYIYTSLPTYDNHLHADCINGHTVEFRWLSVPSESIAGFAVEYSTDGGRSWTTSRKINAVGTLGSVAQQYNMSVEKVESTNAIYRWVSLNNAGERVQVTILDDLSCSDVPTYSLYPNPFTNELELSIYSTTGNKMNYIFEIYNQFGQVVYTKEVSYTESNLTTLVAMDGLNGLSSGVYSFSVKSQGKTLYTSLVVKSN